MSAPARTPRPAPTIADMGALVDRLLSLTRCRDGAVARETWVRIEDRDIATLKALDAKLTREADQSRYAGALRR